MNNNYQTTKESEETVEALWKLTKVILDTLDFKDVVNKIVDSLLSELDYLKLGYRIIVLLLKDEKENVLKRVALSKTSEADKLLAATTIPFPQMDVSLTASSNLIAKAFNDKKFYFTNNWADILTPPFSKDEALSYQKLADINTSMVYPVVVKGKSLGVLIFSLVKQIGEVSNDEKNLIRGFTDIVGLAVQNAHLYSALEDTTKKLKDTNEKLKALDKQKDEFVSMAAHELRSPLTAIKGYVSMVIEGDTGDIPEKARQYLADTGAVTDRLIRLVNNMLNVSRIEEGRIVYQMEVTNIIRVVQEIYNSFRIEAERKNLNITLDAPSGLKDDVYVDPDRFREVISNIVSNAVKFTEKGEIKIKISNPKENSVKVEVIDTGPGISEEEQQKLFQKFYRAESTSGKTFGTGLGLYITRLLVEKFGGKIGLTSEPGEGSNFWFELPISTKGVK